MKKADNKENMVCKICGHKQKKIFEKTLLNKYKGEYYCCENCGFLQVKNPSVWLKEAYSDSIANTDIGLISRNIALAKKIEEVLLKHFDHDGKFLDYAGGYGMFTRMMRDKGFDFYHDDPYSANIFAKTFEEKDAKTKKFEMITAFEYMEHIENAPEELEKILKKTDSFLFSTELVPEGGIENWWYLATETGQHISFYTRKSLELLAHKFGFNYVTNGHNLHLFTKKKGLEKILNKPSKLSRLTTKKKSNKKSLLQSDYEGIKKNMQKKK